MFEIGNMQLFLKKMLMGFTAVWIFFFFLMCFTAVWTWTFYHELK